VDDLVVVGQGRLEELNVDVDRDVGSEWLTKKMEHVVADAMGAAIILSNLFRAMFSTIESPLLFQIRQKNIPSKTQTRNKNNQKLCKIQCFQNLCIEFWFSTEPLIFFSVFCSLLFVFA
jgi:hypothetical protein